MTYPEAIQYVGSFINYEKIPAYPYKESLKLERIKGFLAQIGNPERGQRYLHVAGSKGKGSVCSLLTYILRAGGFKVGLYTSPHLIDFRERIRILKPQTEDRRPKTKDFEGMISKKELARLVAELKPKIEKYNKGSKYGPLTFFEACTALAFSYFKERKTDFAVLETGLGGRLDATNVVAPLACAITPISYEHTDKLGRTLAAIAGEKAGIIKGRRSSPSGRLRFASLSSVVRRSLVVISAPQKQEARRVIRNRCKETGAKLYEVGRDIVYKRTRSGFNIKGIVAEYKDLKTQLIGEHQLINAATAVGVIEAMRSQGINVPAKAIRAGLRDARWPGRCEVISRRPLVVLDGAQNIASAEALKKAIGEKFKYKKLILVLGTSSDKDIKGICGTLRPLVKEVILTCSNNPRAARPQVLAGYFRGKKTHFSHCVKEARGLAKRLATPEDLVLVTGSLFVVGEFRNA